MNKDNIKAVATNDLKQLWRAPDFWGPMIALGVIFFLVVPFVVLGLISSLKNVEVAQQISQALDFLPQSAQNGIPQDLPESTRAAFVLAVYLLSPVAIIVPLTISIAVGAVSIVGEREKGTSEFLAHSPLSSRDIFFGKLIAAFVPGYLTTLVGFALYSLVVNGMLAGDVGYIFFPTTTWWTLVLWVLPAVLFCGLAIILRISMSVKSAAAAQQASSLVTLPLIFIAYGQISGGILGGSSQAPPLIFGAFLWGAGIFLAVWLSGRMPRGRLLGVADEK